MDINQLLELGILEPYQVTLMQNHQSQVLEDLQDRAMRQSEDARFQAWMSSSDAEYGSNMVGLSQRLQAAAATASHAVYQRHMIS